MTDLEKLAQEWLRTSGLLYSQDSPRWEPSLTALLARVQREERERQPDEVWIRRVAEEATKRERERIEGEVVSQDVPAFVLSRAIVAAPHDYVEEFRERLLRRIKSDE